MNWPSKETLIAMLGRILPSFIFEAITKGTGKEIVDATAVTVEYLSKKLEQLFSQMLLKNASSGDYATGEVELTWPDECNCSLDFEPLQLTLYGIKNGGKNLVPYVNTEVVEIRTSSTSPFTIPVRAARIGMDQDILAKRLIRFARHGIHKSGLGVVVQVSDFIWKITPDAGEEAFDEYDQGKVIKITPTEFPDEPVMFRQIFLAGEGNSSALFISSITLGECTYEIAELNELGMSVINDEDIIGGNFPMLEMTGQAIGFTMASTESDEQFQTRVKVSQDKISPNALKRTLKRIMKVHAPGYQARFVDCYDGPETCAFYSEIDDYEVGDEPDPLTVIFDDDRNSQETGGPATAVSFEKTRGYFVVLVPAFDPLPDGWTEEDTKRIYNAVYQAMLGNRVSEVVDFDLVLAVAAA